MDTFAFIGLGAMGTFSRFLLFDLHINGRYKLPGNSPTDAAKGYPMAQNLRTKLQANETLIVFDVNVNATKKFAEEADSQKSPGAGVEVASSARDAAERSVSVALLFAPFI